MKLNQLPLGQPATIVSVGGEGALRRRLLDMGLTPRANVTVRKTAPMGDPIELHVRSYELTIRLDDAKEIEVMPCDVSEKTTTEIKAPRHHRHLFRSGESR